MADFQPLQEYRPALDWQTVTIFDLWIEIAAVAGILVYLLTYYTGNAKNKQIARKWYDYLIQDERKLRLVGAEFLSCRG